MAAVPPLRFGDGRGDRPAMNWLPFSCLTQRHLSQRPGPSNELHSTAVFPVGRISIAGGEVTIKLVVLVVVQGQVERQRPELVQRVYPSS